MKEKDYSLRVASLRLVEQSRGPVSALTDFKLDNDLVELLVHLSQA